jgi:hypothetical protein
MFSICVRPIYIISFYANDFGHMYSFIQQLVQNAICLTQKIEWCSGNDMERKKESTDEWGIET